MDDRYKVQALRRQLLSAGLTPCTDDVEEPAPSDEPSEQERGEGEPDASGGERVDVLTDGALPWLRDLREDVCQRWPSTCADTHPYPCAPCLARRVLRGPTDEGGTRPDEPQDRHDARVSELRSLLAELIDGLVMVGHVVTEQDWERACLLAGRYRDPFLTRPRVVGGPGYDDDPDPFDTPNEAHDPAAHQQLAEHEMALQCTADDVRELRERVEDHAGRLCWLGDWIVRLDRQRESRDAEVKRQRDRLDALEKRLDEEVETRKKLAQAVRSGPPRYR